MTAITWGPVSPVSVIMQGDWMTFANWVATTRPEGLLTAIVAGVIGCVTLYIAWQQKEIAREKVVSELFDRRFKVYDVHAKAIIKIVFGPKIEQEEITKLGDDATYFGEQARFLFNEDVHKHLTEIRRKVFQYNTWSNSLRKLRTGDQRIDYKFQFETHQRMIGLHNELQNELSKVIPQMLMPYLRIKDFRTDGRNTVS